MNCDLNDVRIDETTKQLEVSNTLLENPKSIYEPEVGVNNTIQNATKGINTQIQKEMEKVNKETSILKNTNQSKIKEIIKSALETTLKVVLKKKLNISFSTFNDMKKVVNATLNGNLKEMIKSSSDVALNSLKQVDATTKNAMKTVKNNVIDITVDNQRYEIVNRQTKLVNRIGKNCEELDKAFETNDVKLINKKANAIQKDMKQILPIRETIQQAQKILDKYELWKNNGNRAITEEENELIDKLNKIA